MIALPRAKGWGNSEFLGGQRKNPLKKQHEQRCRRKTRGVLYCVMDVKGIEFTRGEAIIHVRYLTEVESCKDLDTPLDLATRKVWVMLS